MRIDRRLQWVLGSSYVVFQRKQSGMIIWSLLWWPIINSSLHRTRTEHENTQARTHFQNKLAFLVVSCSSDSCGFVHIFGVKICTVHTFLINNNNIVINGIWRIRLECTRRTRHNIRLPFSCFQICDAQQLVVLWYLLLFWSATHAHSCVNYDDDHDDLDDDNVRSSIVRQCFFLHSHWCEITS